MGYESNATAVLSAMRADPATRRHGLDLIRDTGLTSGTLYPTLIRLERAGLVESGWQEHGRRYYVIAPARAPETPAANRARLQVRVQVRLQERTRARLQARARARLRAAACWVPAAGIAAVQTSLALARPADARLPDLAVYMGAVTGRRDGTSLYAFASADQAPFTYPPFAGLVFWPLTFASTRPLQVVWTLGTVAIVIMLSVLLARTVKLPRPAAAGIAAALLLSAPVSSNLRFGQISLGLATLVIVDNVVLPGSRYHGLLTGLAAAMKLTPLIFIPMLWLAGRRRAAIVAGSTFAACGALAWAVLPTDSWLFWGTHMWHASRLGPIASSGNQSVNGMLLRLGTTDPIRTLAVLVVAATVALVALRRAGALGRCGEWLSATVVMGAASIVVSPVSWTHHQVWLVIAALVPVARSMRGQVAWSATTLIIMVFPVTALGSVVYGNARMLIAVGVAGLIPIRPDLPTRPGVPRPRERRSPVTTVRRPPRYGPGR